MKTTSPPFHSIAAPARARGPRLVALTAGMLAAVSLASAQVTELTWVYTGSSTGDWNSTSNWSDGTAEANRLLPDAGTHVLFSSRPGVNATTYINFNREIPGSAEGVRHVGAISLLESDTLGRTIRGNTAVNRGVGNLVFHGLPVFLTGAAYPGISADMEGEQARLLMANHTTDRALQFTSGSTRSNGLAEVTMVVRESGVIYVREGARSEIQITNRLTGDGEPVTLRLMGGGVLGFGTRARNNDYGGGVIIDNGVVEWTHSGRRNANPFGGSGAILTVRKGTLRSTSNTSGRTINVPIHLDGSITFGWDGGTNNANLVANSHSGRLRMQVLSDSTITVHNERTLIHQRLQGAGVITKLGRGMLDLRSAHPSTLNGSIRVAEGTLSLRTILGASPVAVEAGARLEGLGGEARAGVAVAGGGTLAPGLPSSDDPSHTTRGTLLAHGLVMASGSNLEITLEQNPVRGFEHDGLVVTGPARIDGANLSMRALAVPDARQAIVLIDNRSGHPVSGIFHHQGHPLAEGTVVALSAGESRIEAAITYNYNRDGHVRSVALVPRR